MCQPDRWAKQCLSLNKSLPVIGSFLSDHCLSSFMTAQLVNCSREVPIVACKTLLVIRNHCEPSAWVFWPNCSCIFNSHSLRVDSTRLKLRIANWKAGSFDEPAKLKSSKNSINLLLIARFSTSRAEALSDHHCFGEIENRQANGYQIKMDENILTQYRNQKDNIVIRRGEWSPLDIANKAPGWPDLTACCSFS